MNYVQSSSGELQLVSPQYPSFDLLQFLAKVSPEAFRIYQSSFWINEHLAAISHFRQDEGGTVDPLYVATRQSE